MIRKEITQWPCGTYISHLLNQFCHLLTYHTAVSMTSPGYKWEAQHLHSYITKHEWTNLLGNSFPCLCQIITASFLVNIILSVKFGNQRKGIQEVSNSFHYEIYTYFSCPSTLKVRNKIFQTRESERTQLKINKKIYFIEDAHESRNIWVKIESIKGTEFEQNIIMN